MTLSADVKKRVLEAARLEPSPPRKVIQKNTALLLATAAITLVSVFFAFGGIHPGERPEALLLGTAVGWAAIAVAATSLALWRGRSMLGRPGRMLYLVALATPFALLAWAVIMDVANKDSLKPCPPVLAMGCFAITLLMAAWPLVALSFARRGTDPVHPRATGASLGAAAGAWASVAIHLHCPLSSPLHMLLGHVLPAAALVAIGAWLGKRVIALG